MGKSTIRIFIIAGLSLLASPAFAQPFRFAPQRPFPQRVAPPRTVPQEQRNYSHPAAQPVGRSTLALPSPPPFLLRSDGTTRPYQQASPATPYQNQSDEHPKPVETSEEMLKFVNELAREHIPLNYTDDKKWGLTKEVWSGVKLRREGWKLETKSERKIDNHGDWWKHDVELIDPEQLQVSVINVLDHGEGRVQFDVLVAAPLKLKTRYSKWVNGSQLISLSADARARVVLAVRCEFSMKLDFHQLPPDVLLQPVVLDSRLVLQEFRLDRLSKVGGAVANEIGSVAQGSIEKKLEDYRPRMTEKMNAAIEKRRDKLRISLKELASSQWSKLAGDISP